MQACHWGRRIALVALIGLFLIALPAVPAQAAGGGRILYVSTAGDTPRDANCQPLPGSCTLRQAVNASNASDPGAGNTNTIVIMVTGTINLNTEPLVLGHNVVIAGGTALTLTGSDEAFSVSEGVTATIAGLTISGFLNDGISNDGTLTVTNSTFSNNSFGIMNFGTLTVRNSTFSGMRASAILNDSTLTMTSSTVSGNYAGITYDEHTTAPRSLTIGNSIVAGNPYGNLGGPFTDLGYNLTSGDPKLGALGTYGGPTPTMLPLAGSPAIDRGGTAANGCPATDQRGIKRPQGAACDIGAVEVGPPDTTPPTITPTVTGTTGAGGWYTSDVTVTWTVAENDSPITAKTGCDSVTLKSDTAAAGVTYTCSATSTGGTSTKSVTVKRDATKPTVTYSAHPTEYVYGQMVVITCTAADPTPGSGLASTTCKNINAPASSFPVGPNTVSATATDAAGNTQTAQTTFRVAAKPTR